MAEGTEHADGHNMEDWDFEVMVEVMVETDVRGYLYEPQYSDEQLRAMEEQEVAEAPAATAKADDLPAADEEPAMAPAGADWCCLCSHCANGHRTRVSAAENSSSANFFWTKSRNLRMTGTCVLSITQVSHPRLYASSEQLGIGYIFPDPESVLETPAKARREKQTSEQYRLPVLSRPSELITQHGQYRGYKETVDAQDEL
ncbi:unnamed protein product [Boreogadus saida]